MDLHLIPKSPLQAAPNAASPAQPPVNDYFE
jgi:hypothetical protein